MEAWHAPRLHEFLTEGDSVGAFVVNVLDRAAAKANLTVLPPTPLSDTP